ncbi:MAG: hypothetical protein M1818_001745 [Claussenomyces sp. TS43310]|nr:MAG: hypothetical protein M1818_001745 [Claussenomyces sp. TS43310]
MKYSLTAASLFLAGLASATLNIDNWCTMDVYIYQNDDGTCDFGPNGICTSASGAAPWVIPAGNGNPSVLDLDWINGSGTSVKISKTSDFNEGILQFEYTMGSTELYWDLSDLDGSGAGLVGTPFANDNVKVSTTGDGSGSGTCVKIRCAAGELCLDAYQNPDDNDTRSCPADTGDMWVDLCEPTDQFNNKKRGARRARRAIAFKA